MVQLLATKMVTAAAIAGHDGNIWAQSAGFNVTPDEVKKVLGSWDNASAMGMSGVTFNGLRSQKLPIDIHTSTHVCTYVYSCIDGRCASKCVKVHVPVWQ